MTFETSDISDSDSYSKSLQLKVIANFKTWFFAFSASADYQNVQQNTNNNDNVFTKATATCESYTADILVFAPPPLTEDFKKGVQSLTQPYNTNPGLYALFIAEFGTHSATQVTMGGSFGQQSMMTKSAWTSYSESGSSISAGMKASAFGCTAAVNTMTAQQKADMQTFQSYTASSSIYVLGGEIPADGTVESWSANAVADPQVMSYTLVSIDTLLTSPTTDRSRPSRRRSRSPSSIIATSCRISRSSQAACHRRTPHSPL